MPANLYPYDPTGQSAANAIKDEVHTVDTAVDISVFPLHGPVYAEHLKVESLQAGTWVELKEQKDYVYSPLFLSVSASTRMDTVSYILLLDTNHTNIRFNYQAVGRYEDDFLLQQIASKDDLDRKSLHSWLSVMGQTNYWEVLHRNPNVGENGLLEVLVSQLDRLTAALANPYTSNANLGPKVTQLEASVNEAKQKVEDFLQRIGTETAVAEDAPQDIYVHMFGEHAVMEVNFEADDGSAKATSIINAVHLNNTANHVTLSEVKVGSVTLTFTVNSSGGRIVLRGRASKAGVFSTKPLNIT